MGEGHDDAQFPHHAGTDRAAGLSAAQQRHEVFVAFESEPSLNLGHRYVFGARHSECSADSEQGIGAELIGPDE